MLLRPPCCSCGAENGSQDFSRLHLLAQAPAIRLHSGAVCSLGCPDGWRELCPCWYRVGTELVPSWYRPGAARVIWPFESGRGRRLYIINEAVILSVDI